MAAKPAQHVVILGGGLQGCASAYFLGKEKDVKVTIVESVGIAAAASGKGGGFLARGWGSGSTKALHEQSFDLHAELAETLGIESYRKISTLEVTSELGLREWPPKEKSSKPIKKSPMHPAWLDSTDTKARLMDHDTAQVVPEELCVKLFENSGAELKIATATGIEVVEDDEHQLKCTGVRLDDSTLLECDQLVVAMGVWSVLLEDWLPSAEIPLQGILSSSVVYEGIDAIKEEPRALFCAEDSNSCHLEVYPRYDGSVYLCGIGGSDYVSGSRLRKGGDMQDATKPLIDPGRLEAVKSSFSKMSPAFAGKDPTIKQACMRPCAPDAKPLIGRFPPEYDLPTNVVVAAGHNCWGILWAPITGKIVTDLILNRPPTVDLSDFSPARFVPQSKKKRTTPQKKNRGRAVGETQQRVGEQW